MHTSALSALVQVRAELTQTPAAALADARHALRVGRDGPPPPGAPGPVLAALEAHRARWRSVALAQADAVWDALLLPVERTGSVAVARVVARANADQVSALCLGKGRSARAAYQDWFRRCGALADGHRSYAARSGR